GDPPAQGTEPPGPAERQMIDEPKVTVARREGTSRLRLWLAGAVVLGALGFLVVQGLGNATLYFRTADEAVAQRAKLGDRRFRIEGTVVPGTVQQQANDVAFAIQHNGVAVPVRHAGDPPELFKPGIPVVPEGRF